MEPTAKATEAAPAKVNLTLHVTGRRADGYHLLDSLVAFVGISDKVTVAPADRMALAVSGPRAAGVPADARNLVWKAAELLGTPPVAIALEKTLPAAAGIGGGSSDAAAVVRALSRLWDRPLPEARTLLPLGADVPVCLAPQSVRMQGVGEEISPVGGLPPFWILLANPGVEVPTPAVFKALVSRDNPPMDGLPPKEAAACLAWLRAQRNDLEPAALSVEPAIAPVLAALAGQPGCGLTRMSGSGATCFGLFESEVAAAAARASIARAEPGWWLAAGPLL
ncbi:4-(cytidine 5'-diphospho)-2-C-methyl-D-erythritol kinase [Poseidonocella sp. HB161398]|uniref:4-(cytidine 5'-diphospho)-2-C-methyl-D-erythritol kinase n=1 Tax=Poseidonocella sp. HB161398 TaxID=2320855 RepID=UPI001107DE4B|nr:4-(cytidine 5'-diphospho)-2-C-methyl-D-erythritol kinase [Poseidonocella sp. HB161398]